MSSRRWWAPTSYCLLDTQVPNCRLCSPSSSNISRKLWTLASCAWRGSVNAFILRFVFRFVGRNSAQWAKRKTRRRKKQALMYKPPAVTFFAMMCYAMFQRRLQDVIQSLKCDRNNNNKKKTWKCLRLKPRRLKIAGRTVFLNSFP